MGRYFGHSVLFYESEFVPCCSRQCWYMCYYHTFYPAGRLIVSKKMGLTYHTTPIPVMRLAAGDEVSSLYPAKGPSSRNGVSGSMRRWTLSRAGS